MAQREENKGSGGSCGGGATGSSKKTTQKRPPRRGLGIAELERLRLEELQERDNPFSPSPSFCPSVSLPNFSVTVEPSGSLFSNMPPVSNIDFSALVPPVPSRSMSNHWNYNAETRSRVTDLGWMTSSSFLPNQVVGSGHPSLLRNQSWPPSNQIHHGSAPASFGPQGEMRFGAKRSGNFALDYASGKLRKVGNPITSRPEEPSPFSRVGNLRENFGEASSHSSSMMGSSSTDSVKENKVNGGGYLTFAPLGDDPIQSQHFGSGALRRHNLHPGFGFPQYPGHPVGQPMQLPVYRPCYNSLPPENPPDNIENDHNEGDLEDSSESIDLNLKL